MTTRHVRNHGGNGMRGGLNRATANARRKQQAEQQRRQKPRTQNNGGVHKNEGARGNKENETRKNAGEEVKKTMRGHCQDNEKLSFCKWLRTKHEL